MGRSPSKIARKHNKALFAIAGHRASVPSTRLASRDVIHRPLKNSCFPLVEVSYRFAGFVAKSLLLYRQTPRYNAGELADAALNDQSPFCRCYKDGCYAADRRWQQSLSGVLVAWLLSAYTAATTGFDPSIRIISTSQSRVKRMATDMPATGNLRQSGCWYG